MHQNVEHQKWKRVVLSTCQVVAASASSFRRFEIYPLFRLIGRVTIYKITDIYSTAHDSDANEETVQAPW